MLDKKRMMAASQVGGMVEWCGCGKDVVFIPGALWENFFWFPLGVWGPTKLGGWRTKRKTHGKDSKKPHVNR